MMMMVMSLLDLVLGILLERGKCLLGTRKIARFQGVSQSLYIILQSGGGLAGLLVPADLLKVSLKGRKGTLGRGEIS